MRIAISPTPAQDNFIRCPDRFTAFIGGIGSGKTAFSLALEELGCRRFEADRVGHDMLNKVDIYAELVQTFGQEILGPDDRIDRAALARRAFDTPEHAAELNRIVGKTL